MIVKSLIRSMVEEQLVQEARKDRFILDNMVLSKIEKEMLIEMFTDHPNLENTIDWQKSRTMYFDDFADKIKSSLISGLKKIPKNEYIEMKNVDCDDELFIGAYIPLSWRAANILRDKPVGGSSATWCIGYDGDDSYWYRYSYGTGDAQYYADQPSEFIILVFAYEKYAIQIRETVEGDTPIIWDEDDKILDTHDDVIRTFDISKEYKKAKNIFIDVREHLKKDPKQPHRWTIGDKIEYEDNEFGTIWSTISDLDRDSNKCSFKSEVSWSTQEEYIATLNGYPYTSIEDREEYEDVQIGSIISTTEYGETQYFKVYDIVTYIDKQSEKELSDKFKVTNMSTGQKSIIREEDVEAIFEDVGPKLHQFKPIGRGEDDMMSKDNLDRFELISDYTPIEHREEYEDVSIGDSVYNGEYEGTVTHIGKDGEIDYEFEWSFDDIPLSSVKSVDNQGH